jgi:hypothetical protein
LGLHSGEQGAGLVVVDDDTEVDGFERFGRGPPDVVKRVGVEVSPFDRVLQRVVKDRSFPSYGRRRSRRAVEFPRERVECAPGDDRVGDLSEAECVPLDPRDYWR